MATSVFTQLAYYLPSFFAYLVAFGLAAAILTRSRVAGILLGVGTLLQLVASCGSLGSVAWSMSAYEQGDMSRSSISMVTSAIGLAVSVIRALGEVGIAAAVAAAAFGRAAPPKEGNDPYGFPADAPKPPPAG